MNLPTTSPAQPCALCGVNRKLERGHIIPQFVYRWQFAQRDEMSPAGWSRRDFDGPARWLLCGECEDRFARAESEFAREVFHPFATRGTLNVKYGSWLRKFAASVAWRILDHEMSSASFRKSAAGLQEELISSARVWRDYLIGKRPDVGAHALHLIPTEAFFATEPSDESYPSERAVWVGSAIEMEVSWVSDEAVVYAKLGPLVILGLVETTSANQDEWLGTQIHAEGKLKPRKLLVPSVYVDYMRARAALARNG